MSIEGYPFETLLCRSADNGYTWTKPEKVADSSVTPHVVALDDGIVLLIYGRPGVHFKISEDNSVLVLYNNLKYDDGDGLRHKAAFVRKITVER